MNLLLLLEDDVIDDQRIRISDRRFDHIRIVHKPAIGDQLQVGWINGGTGNAVITHMTSSYVELSMSVNTLTTPPPDPLPISLFIALPRPKMIKRILQTCATMGVKDITFFNSCRVEKSYWQSPLLREENIREQLILGLEQGKDTLLPQVTLEKRFKPFVEDRLPSICQNALALVAHPFSQQPCPRQVQQHTVLFIGPEGGFIPYEIEKLEAAGCQSITLGSRILRVETAIPVLLAKLF